MLTAQEIANYLQTELDAIGATRPELYEFSILSEIAKDYDGVKINGMVKTVSPELSPFPKGYVEAKYVFIVKMFVSGPTNRRYLNVNNIVNEFIENNQCSTVDFENGKGIITFSMGVPEGYKIEYEVGEGVPLAFTVRVTYTENAVASADKHWLLDGVEIPFLSESVSVEREGIFRKLYDDVYSKILLTGQTKFYSFRIPYESDTYKSLQFEILQSPAVNGIVHTLTYYDGEAFTKDYPYRTKVSIYRSAKSSSTRPNASEYEVTFTDVYNPDLQTYRYYIALIDFPFDMQGDDTRYFNDTKEQQVYFNAMGNASSAPFIEIEAPNLDGLVITKQVYRNPKTVLGSRSQFDSVSKNYAIIKAVAHREELYFYYFIENATIGADGQVLVDLKMDTVQTYFFNENITFSDCLIERAHLNRFVPADADNFKDATQVKFVTDPATKIYNAEAGFNFPKRLVQRDKLRLEYTINGKIDEWLNDNILYWVYVFIDPSHEYQVAKIGNNFDIVDAYLVDLDQWAGQINYTGQLKGATYCISYPVYNEPENTRSPSSAKNVIKIKVKIGSEEVIFIPNEQGLGFFEQANEDKSYYYNMKISIVPPFLYSDGMSIDSNNCLVIDGITNKNRAAASLGDNSSAICTNTSGLYFDGLFYGATQKKYSAFPSFSYSLPENEPIVKSDITNQQPPNPAYNPKLNGQNFKELVITASSGDTFTYDIQKLNRGIINFEYTEPITPEITKYYFRVAGNMGLYGYDTDVNYTGLVGSTDNSLAYVNDIYAEFIANNKNFYLQSNMKIVSGAVQSGIGIASTALSGDYGGAALSAVSTGIDIATNLIDRSLTVDNMKNAPDQLKNANGNVIFNILATNNHLGLYVEKYSALEGDLNTANDFMNLYGFTFNSVANVRDYVHIRKYHNFVKAQLQSINGNINNIARADLRQRFEKGIRFWNGDVVSYQWENYELELED